MQRSYPAKLVPPRSLINYCANIHTMTASTQWEVKKTMVNMTCDVGIILKFKSIGKYSFFHLPVFFIIFMVFQQGSKRNTAQVLLTMQCCTSTFFVNNFMEQIQLPIHIFSSYVLFHTFIPQKDVPTNHGLNNIYIFFSFKLIFRNLPELILLDLQIQKKINAQVRYGVTYT